MSLPAITELPTAPSRSDAPATFIARADALLAALVLMVPELNSFGNALEVVAQATNYNATSATSIAIGTGNKTFAASPGKLLQIGQFVVVASTASPTNYMFGQVASYSASTGALVVAVTSVGGAGTFAAWTIALAVDGDAVRKIGNQVMAGALSVGGVLSALAGITDGTNDIGGYKHVPQNAQSGAYTLALADAGKHVLSSNTGSQTITLPANSTAAFPIGAAITIINDGSGNITLTPAGGVTLKQAGTVNTGSRTLAANGLATLVKVATDKWFISGVGLS